MPAPDFQELQQQLDQLRNPQPADPPLTDRLAATTAAFQALRSRAELERHRQELRIADLEKLLTQRDTENRKLHATLESLMAEHAACTHRAVTPAPVNVAQLADLRAQLQQSEEECAQLRSAIENSLALKLARSIPWLLRPLRSLFTRHS